MSLVLIETIFTKIRITNSLQTWTLTQYQFNININIVIKNNKTINKIIENQEQWPTKIEIH